jgi:hypothetical protein
VLDAGILGGLGYFFGMVLDPFFHSKAVYVDSTPRPLRSSPPAPDPRWTWVPHSSPLSA